jgi:hypothetical protein
LDGFPGESGLNAEGLEGVIAMMTRLVLALASGALLLPCSLSAQTGAPPGPQARNQRSSDAVKEVLGLTDRQFSELTNLRDSHNQTLHDFNLQLRDLERQRREAMSDGNNAALVGSIAFQVQQIQQQIAEENKAYHEQALTILDGGQREKVEQIQEALKLAPSAGALLQFGLLDTSDLPGRGRFLSGPAGRMMGPGSAPPSGQ